MTAFSGVAVALVAHRGSRRSRVGSRWPSRRRSADWTSQPISMLESPINWGLLIGGASASSRSRSRRGPTTATPITPSDARAAAAAGLAVPVVRVRQPEQCRRDGDGEIRGRCPSRHGARTRPACRLWSTWRTTPTRRPPTATALHIPAMIAWIARFTTAAKDLTGKWPVIYTTAAWWQECTSSTGQFRRDPLWLAAFDGTPPTLPSPWLHWTFWQYSNDGFATRDRPDGLDYYSAVQRPSPTPPNSPSRARQRRSKQARPESKDRTRDTSRTARQGRAKAKHKHKKEDTDHSRTRSHQ